MEKTKWSSAPSVPKIMVPPKQLDLSPVPLAPQDALDHVVQLVRLPRCLPNFGKEDLGVEGFVAPGGEGGGEVRGGWGTSDCDEAVLRWENGVRARGEGLAGR